MVLGSEQNLDLNKSNFGKNFNLSYRLFLSQNIPYLLDRPGIGHHVRGEVFLVNVEQLNKLDLFERVPTHYLRKRIVVVPCSMHNDTSLTPLECDAFMKEINNDQLLTKPFLVEFPIHNNYIPIHKRTLN
jgi:hypothetical protein